MGAVGNARGRETRRRILSAGWLLLDELRLERLFELLPARELAERAGCSERSVRHHFVDGEQFARELLAMPVPTGFFGDGMDYGSVQALREILMSLSPEQTVEAVRAAARANWSEVTEADDVTSLRRQLFFLSRLGAHPELRDRMRDEYYGRYLPLFAQAYDGAITNAGRRLLEPLTLEQFAAALAALSEGLLLQWMTDPDRITIELVVEVSVAVALSLTVAPDDPRRSVVDLECDAVEPVDAPVAQRRELAVASHELFRDGVAHVAWSDVGAALGRRAAEVRAMFASMRQLAATSFGVHLPALAEAASANLGRDPQRCGPDLLCELVRVVRADRPCSEALAGERRSDPATTAELVPLDELVLAAMAGSPATPSGARRMVDTTLTLAITEPGAQPAEVADWALSVR